MLKVHNTIYFYYNKSLRSRKKSFKDIEGLLERCVYFIVIGKVNYYWFYRKKNDALCIVLVIIFLYLFFISYIKIVFKYELNF